MSTNKKTTLVGTALMMKRKKGREEGSDKKKRKSPKLQLALSDKKLRNPRAEYLVVPSESCSLPWCLFAQTESETLTAYPGHVSDFAIRNLLAEFKTLAAQKIVDVLCNTSVRVTSSLSEHSFLSCVERKVSDSSPVSLVVAHDAMRE